VRSRGGATSIISGWTAARAWLVVVAASVAVGTIAYLAPAGPGLVSVAMEPAVRREAFLTSAGGQVSYGPSRLEEQRWQDRECGPDPRPGVTSLTLTYYRGVAETFTGRWATVCVPPSWDAALGHLGDPFAAVAAAALTAILLGGAILIARRQMGRPA
jgi:hypothetical protein